MDVYWPIHWLCLRYSYVHIQQFLISILYGLSTYWLYKLIPKRILPIYVCPSLTPFCLFFCSLNLRVEALQSSNLLDVLICDLKLSQCRHSRKCSQIRHRVNSCVLFKTKLSMIISVISYTVSVLDLMKMGEIPTESLALDNKQPFSWIKLLLLCVLPSPI